MSRERQKITMWKYPYTAIDTIKNMREYGIGPALSHDWERTKNNIGSKLENAVEGVAFGVAVCIAVPLMMYQTYKFIKQLHKSQKANNETSTETLK